MKLSRNTGSVLVGVMLLAGCATDFSPPGSLGAPDLCMEVSGDRGRFLRPGEKTEYVWPTENEGYSREYYYLDKNLMVTISHHGRKEESMPAETRRRVEQVLADHRQRMSSTRP